MVYKWKFGTRMSGDAQKIGEWLERIDVKTPENIVMEAEDDGCPAHECFTWDDHKAAHEFRKHEARMLVNAIVTSPEEDSYEIPAYESVIINEQRQYVPTTVESLTEDDIWTQIAGEAKSTIKSLQHKLNAYSHIRKEQAENAQKYLSLASEAMSK
jgi:hypothetical protein